MCHSAYQRFVRCFWGLNKELASARYFPAINYMESYSEYLDLIQSWWEEEVDQEWRDVREEGMKILQEDDKLQRIIKLIGEDALPERQRLVVETARILKNSFLQQNAFDDTDTYSVPEKQVLMLKTILHFYRRAREIIKPHLPLYKFLELPVVNEIQRMKEHISNNDKLPFELLSEQIDIQMRGLEKESMEVV
jgi:V/A-type H+-transporting ATPase subunit A